MGGDYSALELARAAGFGVLRVPEGGVTARVTGGYRILEVGPDASDVEIVRIAARYSRRLPAAIRACIKSALSSAK